MKQDDYQKFVNCLIGCAEIADKQLSKQAILIYWQALKHLEIAVVVDAFNRHIVNPDFGQFMPKPADIIKLTSGSILDSAMMAWSVVLKSIKSIGRYESIVFDDQATMSVIMEMGGWIELCKVEDNELPFRASEFQKRYKSYKTMGRSDTPNKLIGVSEATNQTNGKAIQLPVLVGDKCKARQILSGSFGDGKTILSEAVQSIGRVGVR